MTWIPAHYHLDDLYRMGEFLGRYELPNVLGELDMLKFSISIIKMQLLVIQTEIYQ